MVIILSPALWYSCIRHSHSITALVITMSFSRVQLYFCNTDGLPDMHPMLRQSKNL